MLNTTDRDRAIGFPNTYIRKQRIPIPWIWEGVIAESAVTLLSAPEKIGKTTLLSLFLDRRRAGGQLLGRAVRQGRTILCSEEHQRLWALRQPPLDFGPDLIFHDPGTISPTRRGWKRFIGDLETLWLRDDPFDLLVVDTAAHFLPLGSRNARIRRWAISQLREVADFSAGVLIINQSRNVHRPLAAFADIIIEMAIPRLPQSPLGQSERTRRRLFTGVGRYPDTLPFAAAELNSEGTDYILLPDTPAPHSPLLPTLQALLAESPSPLTRHDLLARWPGPPPREDSLWRTLARACELGLFIKLGAGTKIDAFRYAVNPLAGQQEACDASFRIPPGAEG